MKATEPIAATGIETTPEGLVLVLGKRRILVKWEKCSKSLALATETERLHAELSPGGFGIHWPLIDEDLSVHSLLRDLP